MKNRHARIVLFAFFVLFSGITSAQVCGDGQCAANENCIRDCNLDTILLLKKDGGRVDWCPNPAVNLVAFDKAGSDGFYDICVMSPDGSNERCITCGSNAIGGKHNGQPAWHPSGNWIVFQSEKKEHPGGSAFSTPGRGVYCDLWLVDPAGKQYVQLTNLPVDKNCGVLHPHFSDDGKKLSWSEMYEAASMQHKGTLFGKFKLKVADFGEDSAGKPFLSNIKEYIPGDSVLYENHGFSPDGKYLIFMSNFNREVSSLKGNKIYRMDLATREVKLMAGEGYNEHATYTPDGKYVVFASDRENANHGMDYWIEKADGSGLQRLTYFNRKNYPEYLKKGWAVDMSWSPDGKILLAYVQDNLMADAGSIYIIKFKHPPGN